MSENAVVPMPKQEVAAPVASSPIEACSALLSQGCDLEYIEKMLALQEKFDAMSARKAFTLAMAAFKADPPCITKDKVNNQYK